MIPTLPAHLVLAVKRRVGDGMVARPWMSLEVKDTPNGRSIGAKKGFDA